MDSKQYYHTTFVFTLQLYTGFVQTLRALVKMGTLPRAAPLPEFLITEAPTAQTDTEQNNSV